jgi:hypothetical protein
VTAFAVATEDALRDPKAALLDLVRKSKRRELRHEILPRPGVSFPVGSATTTNGAGPSVTIGKPGEPRRRHRRWPAGLTGLPGFLNRISFCPTRAAERRRREAALIRTWQPWQHATGPRTAEGKKWSARNAYRGGYRPLL